MRSFSYLLLFFLLTGISACEKKDAAVSDNSVERYVKLLKANKYDAPDLPAFTANDIPALLNYINESQVITDFPHNPVSSLFAPNCKLGMYILWTIESIRSVENKSSKLIMRFPSQNPMLALRSSADLAIVLDDQSQLAAAKAYADWWNNNKTKNFADFKDLDPLANTPYRWH